MLSQLKQLELLELGVPWNSVRYSHVTRITLRLFQCLSSLYLHELGIFLSVLWSTRGIFFVLGLFKLILKFERKFYFIFLSEDKYSVSFERQNFYKILGILVLTMHEPASINHNKNHRTTVQQKK